MTIDMKRFFDRSARSLTGEGYKASTRSHKVPKKVIELLNINGAQGVKR